MITVSTDKASHYSATVSSRASCIIAQPNQSANWQANKQILLYIGLASALIATIFSLLGAWLILPFAGLEITALGAALYIVCRKQSLRHVLHFSGDQLLIEKGCNQPEQVWQCSALSTFIVVERQPHPWDPIKISLCNHCANGTIEHISFGGFLNKVDSDQLLKVLRDQGLRVRNDSLNGQRSM